MDPRWHGFETEDYEDDRYEDEVLFIYRKLHY
jgi:hypothetical protein